MKIKTALNYIIAGAIIATLFLGCAKDGPMGPPGSNGATGQTGPLSSGNIYGYVKKSDQYGSVITVGLNGVTVHLSGNSKNMTTTTDSLGKYEFDGLTTGNYQISYSDSGYGSNLLSNFQFLGGTDTTWVRNIYLSQLSLIHI